MQKEVLYAYRRKGEMASRIGRGNQASMQQLEFIVERQAQTTP